MKALSEFQNLPMRFWADVRTIGEAVGYTDRRSKSISLPSSAQIRSEYIALGLDSRHLFSRGEATEIGRALLRYFEFRAQTLNEYVEPRLMDAARAQREFERLHSEYNPRCPLPLNKQRGDKRAPAYFTGIVNMIVERYSAGIACDYDPRELTKFTRQGFPLRTLARRVDGAFPAATNPIALWEIKEYYYTTTFGSRVADGVYETLLDGMELQELANNENVYARHYLMVDSHYTWWECGRSYLCRMMDMLHMGYVDEVLFGYEVIERLPHLVKEWVEEHHAGCET